MKFELEQKESGPSFINKITYILVGILITTTILAGLQNALENLGIALGLLINIGLAYHLIKKGQPGSWKRIMGYTIIWTIAISALVITSAMIYISSVIDKVV